MKTNIQTHDARRWNDMNRCVSIAQHARHPSDRWTVSEFATFHRQPCSQGITATIDGEIVGYALIEMECRKIHLHQLIVDPKYRGCGVGDRLIEAVVRKTVKGGPDVIVAELRESDVAAQTFLQRFSGKWTETMRGYYVDPVEDCYVMKMRIW